MKLVKSILALAAAVLLGTSAQAADATEGTEDITLMASETSSAITTTETALKWYVTKDDTAVERLDVKIERLVDSTAKVTITANGTEAGEKVAVLGLYASKGGGDDVLVKTINVTITAKEDKDYLAENTTGTDHSVISEKDAKVIHIGDTWEYTTVTKGSNWTLTRADGTYKQYTLNSNFSKYMLINGAAPSSATLNLTANADGTVTFSVTGKESAGTKALILSLRSGGDEVMKIQIIVDKVVENISMKKGETVRREAYYGETGTDRRWVFNNDGTAENAVSLAVKNGETAMGTTGVTLQNHPEFKWQTTSWQQRVNTDLTANKLGNQVVSIARLNGSETSFATMYEYNVHVYDEKATNITMTAGERFPIVFESEEAGAWEVEGLAEDDETVSMSAYSGWHATSFETEIIANKATEEGEAKTFTVKNNFCVYTVNVTIKKGMEIKNISVAANGEYVDETIEGAETVQSDDTGIATIERNSDTKVTIRGVVVGDTVCVVKDDGGKTNYLYNVTVYSTETKDADVGLGKTANIDCKSTFVGAWTAQLAEGAEEGVVAIMNAQGEPSTEFKLILKGLKVGTTQLLVKNAYAQYKVNVEVSEELENIDLSMNVEETVVTNLTFGDEQVYWTAVAKTGGDVATVTIGSDPASAIDATVEAVKAGNAQWTVYVGETAGAQQYTAYTMNIKVWESNELEAVSMKVGEKKTLTLTSAAQDSWMATSSDDTVAKVSPATYVTSTSFAPEIEAVGEGEATITVKNAYVIYTIKVTVERPTISIKIEQGEGVADVLDENGDSVDEELELPADATEVTLTLKEDVDLTIPVFKVVCGNVTNVTTKVATYDIADGDTLKFFAEEAEEDDPTVTPAQRKAAIIDAIDEPDWDDEDDVKRYNDAKKKVEDVVGDNAEQVSAKDLAAYITKNSISSGQIAVCDYVAASVKLDSDDLITEETLVEIAELVKAEGDGLTFEVYISEDQQSLSLVGVEAIKDMVEASSDLTAWDDHKLDVKAEFDPNEYKVTITPKDPTDKAFMRVVIPKDPGVDGESEVESQIVAMAKRTTDVAAGKKVREAVSVTWTDTDGSDIPLKKVVSLDAVKAGDLLYAWNADTKIYDCWKLSETKVWEAQSTVKVSGDLVTSTTPSADRTFALGEVIWLERQDTSKPVHLYGGVDEDAELPAINKGMNLLSAPNFEAVDLDETYPAGTAVEGDEVTLPIPDKAPKTFTFKDGAWGYQGFIKVGEKGIKPGRVTATPDEKMLIPAGHGFWYNRIAK